jgi:3-hydroxybutyryl-CoA dehydrogenase
MSTRQVGVIGGGLMGTGIAVQFALAGHEVKLLEESPERRRAIPGVIDGIMQELRLAGVLRSEDASAASSLIQLADVLPAFAATPLVIEAIPEILEAKRALYRQLEAVIPAEAVVASNTSGFMPDDLSAGMARPERFLITHFWNPPHAIPLVEIVPGGKTNPRIVQDVFALLRTIGSEPVILQKAVPGFIGNRIQFAVLREALNLVEAGVADPATIDTVVKASLGKRYGIVGPFEAADLGGLETFLRVATHLLPALATDARGLEVLRAHLDRGETGAAAGAGFYRWTPERREAVRQQRIAHQLKNRPRQP